MHIRAYLRASTGDQDAGRGRADLDAFVAERGLPIVGYYSENESGTKLERPELFRLLSDSRPGDVLLIEQVDRLSRLTSGDWSKLRKEITDRQVRIVALDLPTSHMLADEDRESFTARMAEAINSMLLDMLAAVARKDYEDRRRRQAQGQAKAKAEGRYKGRPANEKRNAGIARMLSSGMSYSQIHDATNASRATIAKISRACKLSGFATTDG
ncbi:putative resolvase [Aurantimonas manganoxydans SI85-9A1]|uniref:Putative resolvase n=1 Tax=Aurantimonas manganoxydans (strain ATCC BAA-1229 / DSM 21871 / SI85-9A1) TaxID=287752 RepID=Q1YE80_AURMS|nr:recombinase family protein [Aurantimonas manganoxydans]EAS48519.1 putative resolvase [Aurantimonas manganoxydans SI85-9A1]